MSTFEIAAEEATRIGGEVMPLDVTPAAASYRGDWVRVPAGPVLGIAPFNFPLNLVAHKVAPALACGCSIVLKPPPQAPLTSLLLAEIVRGAGAPEDAVLVVPCANDVAEELVKDDRFATLSFTGSAKVGWALKAIAGKKRVLLELGGNAAAIVHDDADRAWALERVIAGAFGYAGQVCIKVQRLYVHEPIADAFIAELSQRARAISPASPLDDKTLLGPMIDEANAKRVEAWVEEARAAGGRVLCGGTREGAKVLADGDRVRGRRARDEGGRRGGLRPGAHGASLRRLGRRARGWRTRPATACRRGSSPTRARRVREAFATAPRRRAHRQRRADVPRRLDAVRRDARLGARARGGALRDRGDDRAEAPRVP